MKRVSIIGSGAVAEALAISLARHPIHLEVAGRNSERVAHIASLAGCRSTTLSELDPEGDIYIMAVSDDAIEPLSKKIQRPEGCILLHTAGSVPRGSLDGVLYPMQSFTRGREVDLRTIPIFIEGESPAIREVAQLLSDHIYELDSEGRQALHIAAVFACNFTNAMFVATHEILTQHEIPFELYRPLIEETIGKVLDPTTTPIEVQTGVARRGDLGVQQRHVEQLGRREDLIEIYKTISKYIWETSRKI